MTENIDCGCEGATGTTAVLPVKGLSLCVELDGVLGELPSGGEGPDFSLEEQWTGRRWIDGKKIWQKTVDCGGLTNGQKKMVAHGIDDLDKVLSMRGYSFRLYSGEPQFINLPFNDLGTYGVSISTVGSNIHMNITGNYSAFTESYITLLYTRTGD